MNKRWFAAVIGLALAAYCGMVIYSRIAVPKKERTYFSILPITNWTNDRFPTPCLSIRIGDKTISSMLDLGFRGQFSLGREVLASIEDKTYLGSDKMYGFNGKEFQKRVFEIPSIHIGGIVVDRAVIQEEAEDFQSNSVIYTENEVPSIAEPGTIGWEVFEGLNVYLDLGNEKIAVCDSLARLEKEGYAIHSFTKTPLRLSRGLLEITTQTSDGPLQCVLDTGCTFNCLNDVPHKGPLDIKKLSQFNISGKNFGPVDFLQVSIQLPIHVDAILGMEFFMNHVVFLDFVNKFAYISL